MARPPCYGRGHPGIAGGQSSRGGVKHMAEVTVAMAEVTLASVVEVVMAMVEVNHHRATDCHITS